MIATGRADKGGWSLSICDITQMFLIATNPPLRGREKYLGGELGSNSMIYMVPGHALRVSVVDPSMDPPMVTSIGPEFHGEFR
jgi:hypothetical protein